jgi:hypothetical protein
LTDVAKVRKRAVKRLMVSGIFIAACVLMFGLCALLPGLVDGPYLRFSRWIAGLLGFVTSFLPLSFAELLAIGVIVTWLVMLGKAIAAAVRSEDKVLPLLSFAGRFLLSVGILAFLFTLLWGLNYAASPLEEKLKLDVRERGLTALEQTALWMRDLCNETAGMADRDGGIVSAGGFFTLREDAADGFEALAAESPLFEGTANLPKRITFWPVLSYTGIAGIYFPWTAEPCVNPDGPDSTLPYTMCHEMAHSLGFAAEDDANFIAFLACERNYNGNFNYSGALEMFIYLANAVNEENPAFLAELYDGLEYDVAADLTNLTKHYEKYEGPAQAVGSALNDAYLKTVGRQPEGVKSYGRVVDLLIAEYVNRYGEPIPDEASDETPDEMSDDTEE